MSASALKDRSEDITRWVTEAIAGLGFAPKPMTLAASWNWAKYHQAILLYSRDVHGTKEELQDVILGRVKDALYQGGMALQIRNADPSWGWRVKGTRDITGHPKWEAGMPRYACFIEWKGPMPETWPHQVKLGIKEDALSYPVEPAPTWED